MCMVHGEKLNALVKEVKHKKVVTSRDEGHSSLPPFIVRLYSLRVHNCYSFVHEP